MKIIEIKLYKFNELSKEAQQKAIKNRRELNENNNDFLLEWIIDDCYLLEPPHKEVEKLYKKLKLEYKNPLIKNSRKVYFDLYRKTIDISEGMKIQDNYIFLKWLGLNDRLIEKVSFRILDDTIEIEQDFYHEKELTQTEENKINKAVEKFEDHCTNILSNIEKSYEYYFTDEYIKDDLINNEYDFTEDGEIF